jgi:pyruvate kinase
MDMGARAIVLLTSSGRIARLVAKYRPDIPVFSATNSAKVAAQGNTNFGVIPLYLVDPIKRVSDVVDKVVEYANKGGIMPVRALDAPCACAHGHAAPSHAACH